MNIYYIMDKIGLELIKLDSSLGTRRSTGPMNLARSFNYLLDIQGAIAIE